LFVYFKQVAPLQLEELMTECESADHYNVFFYKKKEQLE